MNVAAGQKLRPFILAVLALLGVVVAGNFPPDSADAADRMVYVCINPPTYELLNKRECPDGIGFSWSATSPELGQICVLKKTRQMLISPRPDRCGPGKTTLIYGTYSATKKMVIACVDRRTKKMYLAKKGKCGKRAKLNWVKSAPYLPVETTTTSIEDSTTTTEEVTTTTEEPTTTSSTSTSSTTTTVAPSCANGQAPCSLGDTGPGGGKVFYVDTADDFGWDYLEVAPDSWADEDNMNWICSAEYSTRITTGTEIGDGRSNTLNMYHAAQSCGGGLIASAVVPGLVFGGKSDWFIPSLNELVAMVNQNVPLGLGMDETTTYWSSSQSAPYANMAWGWDFVSDTAVEQSKGGSKVRPIRAFGSDCEWGGDCALGDTGPGGGFVFYIDSADEFEEWTYMEIAKSDWYGASELVGRWCDSSAELGGTTSELGGGQGSFGVMVANCTGIAQTVSDYESEYLDLNIGDWFIPSDGEINIAYSAINGLGLWTGFSRWAYWTSSEALGATSNARVLLTGVGYTQSTIKSEATVGVVPVRSF